MTSCVTCGETPLRAVRTAAALRRCARCGVVYRARRWESREVIEHYHDYYAATPVAYDPLTEARYHGVLARLERGRHPGRLLDVGCGMGHFLAVAEERGWDATGLEVSASGIDVLQRVKAERGYRFSVVAGELLAVDVPAPRFSAVTMFEVLEHLADPLANLRKVHELLEPGGLLYVTTPNFNSATRFVLGSRWRAICDEHLCLFTPGALRRWLAITGFRSLRVVTKNIDIPEILAKWRAGRATLPRVATREATQTLRHTIEGSRALRLLKAGANVALRGSGLGDTIEVLAAKNDAHPGSRH